MSKPLFGPSKVSTAHHARAVLKKFNITKLPLDPRIILQSFGNILLKEEEFSDEFDGCIFKKDGSALICINKSIPYETRKNFTIAHELGHFVIPHHNRDFRCQRSDIDTIDSVKVEEAEANEFATELLMPEDIVLPIVEEGVIGFEIIKSIANLCATSLSSSAHRYIKFTSYPAALVVSQNKNIKYVTFSKELLSHRDNFLLKGKSLSKNSVAVDYFNDSGKVISSAIKRQTILPSAWFSSLDSSMADCFEESIGFSSLGLVMSLVWIEGKDDEIDLDDY
ncbi:MAG: ImmA/IrrE family metallo-endopeptidase [Candidatus Omnitrophota bacterium]